MGLPSATRLVEWVGKPSLLAEPLVAYKLTAKLYTPEQELLIRRAAEKRFPRVDGYTRRVIERGYHDGLSRSYEFGPDVYVVEMTANDAALLLASPLAKEFVDISDGTRPLLRTGPPVLPVEPVSEEEFADYEQFVARSGWRRPAGRREVYHP